MKYSFIYICTISLLGSSLIKTSLKSLAAGNLKEILRSVVLVIDIFITVLFYFVNWRKSSQNIVDEVLDSRTDDSLHEILICVDEVVEHVSNPAAHELADLVVQKKTSNFKLNHDADFCFIPKPTEALLYYTLALPIVGKNFRFLNWRGYPGLTFRSTFDRKSLTSPLNRNKRYVNSNWKQDATLPIVSCSVVLGSSQVVSPSTEGDVGMPDLDPENSGQHPVLEFLSDEIRKAPDFEIGEFRRVAEIFRFITFRPSTYNQKCAALLGEVQLKLSSCVGIYHREGER